MDEVQDKRLGTIVDGRYRILSRLAAGGMGVVYRAERIQLKRAVAIKFLHVPPGASADFNRRFEVEARAMSRLSHPNCVSIIDFGVHDTPYLVMEFVTGKTLRAIMEEGRVPVSRSINLCRQLLAGLAHAHNQQIVHRDVKPVNIIVTEDVTGTGDLVRILDFGLAKLRDAASSMDGSLGNVALGTPYYMAPEQIRGEQVDARSDVYSVGIVLFELLSRHKPFVAEQIYDLLRMQIEAPPPTLKQVAPELDPSGAMEAVIAKALAKDRDQRFQTAESFAQALQSTPEAAAKSRASLAFADTLAVDVKSLSGEASALIDSSPSAGGALDDTTQPPLDLFSRPEVHLEPPARAGRSRFVKLLLLGVVGLALLVLSQKGWREDLIATGAFVGERIRTWAIGSRTDNEQASRGGSSTALPVHKHATDGQRQFDGGDVMPADSGMADATADSGVADATADRSVADLVLDEGGFEETGDVSEEMVPDDQPDEKTDELADDQADEPAGDQTDELADDKPEDQPIKRMSKGTAGGKAKGKARGTTKGTTKGTRATKRERQLDGAIGRARQLQAKYPKRAYYAFSLGRLYCKRKYYVDCINAYRQAIRLDRKYRKTAPLIRDSVSALGSKRAHRLASWLLIRHIGKPAIPYLRKSARRHKNPALRNRAQWVHDRLARKR